MTKSVFLVEDDSSIVEALRMVLETYGYKVTVALNGLEALKQLRESVEKPCLILLDLMMPVMDGFEFLKEKSHDPGIDKIPVVVFSADNRFESKVSQESNVVGCLKKPADIDELLKTVECHCA